MRGLSSACVLVLLAAQGCDPGPGKLALASPSAQEFELSVYPVLLRDCGFPACHGTAQRFLQVFGPGRERLSPDTDVLDPPTSDELSLSFGRALSMLDGSPRQDALLLRKPLARSAGGAGHKGDDPWGHNVYRTKRDVGYQVLLQWARSSADKAEEAP